MIDHTYWTFNLSPYIFEVQNIPFAWVSTWWGILSLLIVFGGGLLLTRTKLFSHKANSVLRSVLVYALMIFLILFCLQKFHVAWGLRWYSTMYIVGFTAVYLGCLYWSNKKVLMMTPDSAMSFITYTMIGMLLGARLTYVFVYDWDLYRNELWRIVATWEGGLSFHGGIVGVILAMLLFCKVHKVPFFHIGDKISRMIPIGIGLGRLGNFMNGELWGREIARPVPWGIIFPNAGAVARHPSQLYQSLFEGWLLFFTLYFISRWPQRQGTISSCFIMFYCIYRFPIEYFRAADAQVNYLYLNHGAWAPLGAFPETPWWLILTMGQILCVVFLGVGLVMFAMTRKSILEGSPEWLKRNELYFKNVELEQNK